MASKIIINQFKTSVGELTIGSFEEKLCLCDWTYRKMHQAILSRIQKSLNAEIEIGNSKIIAKTKQQLLEYLNKERMTFDIELLFCGTVFQKSVWNELLKVPFGKTESYLGLSQKLNNEKAIRAVASANGANAIAIIVPCHRIIGKSGKLVGYAGGLSSKKKLLDLENQNKVKQLQFF